MNELKPCPFCGSEAYITQDQGWQVNCKVCCETSWYNTPQEAIEAWNRREKEEV
jgi:hypothetical protein